MNNKKKVDPDLKKDGYVKVSNSLVKKFSGYRLSGEEWNILWTIIGKTWAWDKATEYITLEYFYNETKMKKPSIIRAIKKLINKNIVSKKANGKSVSYHINSHFNTWKSLAKKLTHNSTVSKKANGVSNKANEKTPKLKPRKRSQTPTHTIQHTLKTNTSCCNSKDLQISNLLLDLIRIRKPDFKKPDIKKWAKEIHLMIKRDNRNPENIEKVIEWCQNDSFWKNNILSTAKLRKQFDMLELKMNEGFFNDEDVHWSEDLSS